MKDDHCSAEQILAFIDGRLAGAEKESVAGHIRSCEACAALLVSISEFDERVRNMPLERMRGDFTRTVMEKLRQAPKSPLLFRMLENVAYLFGLGVVLAITLAVFLWTGVIDSSQVDAGETLATRMLTSAGGRVSGTVESFTHVLKEYLPFAFGRDSLTISMFVVVVVVVLAVTDRKLGRRFVHRRG